MRRGCGLLVKAQTTAQVDVPTAPRQCCVYSLMSALFLSLRRRSHHIGMKDDVTVWDFGLFDPARCAHLLGFELKIGRLSRLLISSHGSLFTLKKVSHVFFHCPRCSASSAGARSRRSIWTRPRSTTCGPSGRHSPVCWSELATTVKRPPDAPAGSRNVLFRSTSSTTTLPRGGCLQRPDW